MKYLAVSILFLLIITSCKKEPYRNVNDTPTPTPISTPPPPVLLNTADSVINVQELPSGSKEATRLAQSFPASDYQPTGFYLPPNTNLNMEVSQLSGSRLPVLLVGTYSRYQSKWDPTSYSLNPGINTISDAKGGILYLRYLNDNPVGNVRIKFLSGMRPIPFYQLGKTAQADWVKMVDNISNVPDVQLVGSKTILTFSLANAQKYKNENQEALIRKADRVVAIEDSISGLFGNDPLDQPNVHRYLMTESDHPNYYMAATWYRTWYRSTDAVTSILTADKLTWGPWHELGHMHQQGSWTWSEVGEVTVNVYSLAVEKALGVIPGRLNTQNEWNNINTYLARPENEKSFNSSNASVWVRLGMFQQLKLAFGDSFYHELHRKARRESNRPTTTDTRMHWFMVKSSMISGKDLSGFFKKWGMKLSSQPLTDAVYTDIANLTLPVPGSDLTLLKD